MTKVSIYQVFTRLFGNEKNTCKTNGTLQENGVGKMNDFTPKALQEIKKLGISHIWYTGILAHAKCFGNDNIGLTASNPQITKGLAGSPYAISDYYDVDADLAENQEKRMQEFEDLVKRTHQAGLKVVIDFVPNHVAREYQSNIFPEKTFGINDDDTKSFLPSNDFYYLVASELQLPKDIGTQHPNLKQTPYKENPAKATGNDKFSPYLSKDDWYETIKLNYGVDYFDNQTKYFSPKPPLWDKMLDILKYWAKKGVDAFRCDMAEMLPLEFWEYAIAEMKKEFPNLIFIAEIYNPALYDDFVKKAKFDFLYNKVGLYDTLRAIIENRTNTRAITQCEEAINGYSKQMLNFIENHDEQRLASPYFGKNSHKGIPAMLACATLHNGAVMTYFGQEVGEPALGASGYSGDDGRTTIFDYFNVPELQKWVNGGKFNEEKLSEEQKKLRQQYTEILNLSISDKVFSEGSFYDLMWANTFEGGSEKGKLYAYLRFNKKEIRLVVLNFSDHAQQFTVKIPEDALEKMKINSEKAIKIKGIFNDERFFSALLSDIEKRGLWLNMEANSGRVLAFEN